MRKTKWLCMLCLLLLCAFHLEVNATEKQTIYNSPYVSFSPDGHAWTTNAGDRNYEQYINPDKYIKVLTGLNTTLKALETGEHYYRVQRQGEIPICQWVVEHERSCCIHNAYPESGYFHDINYGTQICRNSYYSGWMAYCADCGERVTDMFVYMSMEAAESIDYLEVSSDLDYFYLCPHCTNLEQGSPMKEHICKAISYNQYKVRYDANTNSAPYGGYMEDSIHMYNNANEYEGTRINPVTHLSRNGYTRIGYEFVGWNTKADGSGTAYEDGAEIYNLSSYDWNETGAGIVILYAQWVKSESTLEIDPAGGSYGGSKGITEITQSYASAYVADSNKIVPPSGYTLTFETNGGQKIEPITGTLSFLEWIQKPVFAGRMVGETYYFLAPNGSRDRLEAAYIRNTVTLPEAFLEGSSFGGWYTDEKLTKYVGGAGMKLIPQKNMTLYAQWVDLKLDAVNNMSANSGKGAVDLAWTQADMKSKVYRLYQQKEDGDWIQIHSANDLGDVSRVTKTFLYTGEAKSYTVPHTGLYTLTVNGAQGGSYANYTGGLGGRVTAQAWLEKGEVITYRVGGQNGYNCGGTGGQYGSNGGGRTTVYSNLKGTLLIAGGGGGASASGNGGVGGSGTGPGMSGEYGENGQAGGGGGYVGGKAGEVIVHEHEDACYLDHVMLSTTSSNGLIENPKSYQQDSWLSAFQLQYGNFATVIGNCYSISVGLNSLRATTRETNKFLAIEYGRIPNPNAVAGDESTWYKAPEIVGYGEGYIPVDGNKQVTIDVLLNGMHDDDTGAIDETQTYLKVCNQDGEQIFIKFSSEVEEITKSYWHILGLDTSKTCKFVAENGLPGAVRFVETITLPEGTESIYFTAHIGHNAEKCWMEVDVNKIIFSGGRNNPVICGYSQNQVISSKPAYGGSNYVNTDCVISYTQEAGKKQGDGNFAIQSDQIGFLEGHELKAVTATDYAAPEAVSDKEEDMKWTAVGQNTLQISWEMPEDNGTLYRHKAESYVPGAGKPLCTSNITENKLISGVAGYYYIVDTYANTAISKSNGIYITDNSIKVVLNTRTQYLHIVPVDAAGNMGAAVHILLGNIKDISQNEEVEWQLVTQPLQIEEGESVYRAIEEGTYYVRSDGKSPFTLRYTGVMNGPATERYQPNYMIYETKYKRDTIQNSFYIPADSIREADISIDEKMLQYFINGPSPMERYPYSEVVRSECNRKLTAVQKFTLKETASGERIDLYPRLGATGKKEIVYSDLEDDKLHGITIIGDGEVPGISGLEILEHLEEAESVYESLELQLRATDVLSGVREFNVTVRNMDNAVEKCYEPDAQGVITFTISNAEQAFQGNYTITVYAVDNVGNAFSKSYGAPEFTLEVTIERLLQPHEPIFKGGESGVLKIVTYGYADYVEVEFPEELVQLNPELNRVYDYTADRQYKQEEQLQFMIPLYAPANRNYTVKVRARKGGRVLEDAPMFATIETGDNILEELRTRLR